VIVVQEVVFAYGAHIRENAFPHLHAELLERHTFPFGGSLHHLGIDGVLVVIVGKVELDGGP
jgi:hypothetical protein